MEDDLNPDKPENSALSAIRLSYGSEPDQFGDLTLPGGGGPHPVVIVIHGGFWRARYTLGYFEPCCQALARQGYASWNIEYRRVGNPGGGWPGTLQDTGLAADFLATLATQYKLDLSRVVAIGHSAGGHLAAWLAGRPKIPAGDPLYSPTPLGLIGVVSMAGVLDLRQGWELKLGDDRKVVETFMGGSPRQFPERYATASPANLLPLGVPQVLVHGTADRNVPFEISQQYYQKAKELGENIKLVALPGAGHFEMVDPTTTEWEKTVEAVRLLVP